MKRSNLYAGIADQLARTCSNTISNDASQACDDKHGLLWDGTIYYCAGEMVRVRNADINNICEKNYTDIITQMLTRSEDDHVLKNCFSAMGLGMLGKADDNHPILSDKELREKADGVLRVTDAYDDNWEAFNACLCIGRSLLFGDDPALLLPHLKKMDDKYLESGYFDDSESNGVYNNYGLMTINYSLRSVEFLDTQDPVRLEVEGWFKPHARRYIDLLKTFINHDGMGWVFGRSAGVLGQLQCLVLLEQVLSKGWLNDGDAAWARRACRQVVQYMQDVFWDDDLQWFCFRDEHRSCYNYRNSLPMAWDLWRYFLQLEDYAQIDEANDQDELDELPKDAFCKEIITSSERKTAYLVWSNGDIKWQMPIMGGPGFVSSDTMPRPFLPGLFEWCTGSQTPVLCPRFSSGDVHAWPAWWPASTRLEADGDAWRYFVHYDHLVDDHGNTLEYNISVDVEFYFGDGFFERSDCFHIASDITFDQLRIEVLQGTAHPKSKHYPQVFTIDCSITSDFPNAQFTSDDVTGDDEYRNYYSHPSRRWSLDARGIVCVANDYHLKTSLRW